VGTFLKEENMNCKRGFKRITFFISIIAFLVSGIMSFVYFYNETKEELPRRLESLKIHQSLLEEKESEVSEKLREQSPVLLKDLNLIDYYKKDISSIKKLIPPAAYFYNLIFTFFISLGVFISIWIAYYILRYFLIWIINPLMKWLVLGFAEEKPKDE
jgi:cell division protein FtsX